MRRLGKRTLLLISFVVVLCLGAPSDCFSADEARYQVTTIRGKLTDPSTSEPMAGATIRFQPVEEGLEPIEALTSATGAFVVTGLGFANYVIEITTSEGEKILGINELPIVEGKPVVVEMKISERIVSTTSLENRPQRFAAVVDRQGINWRKFWKEFAIFFGVAAGGAAAL